MIILVDTITPRLQYISQFIGNEIIGQAPELVTNQEIFDRFEGAKINYTRSRINDNDFWIPPHALLFENNIRSFPVDCIQTQRTKAFFGGEGDFPFDIFASAFYLLSRYEEWLPHKKDMYGRYAHENSIAFREGFLDQPLINQWLMLFKKTIEKKFPSLRLRKKTQISSNNFLPTYDIDEAWSYLHKDWSRTAAAMAKAVLTGHWSRIGERMKVLSGKVPDPYDSFEWMDLLHDRYNLQPRYFFLVSAKTGKYDRNILPEQKKLQELIRKHADRYSIGVHPSWQSGDDPSLLKSEIKTIEEISGKPFHSSRQHFIRFNLPSTYRYLIDAGIQEDFSMGYGSINGFRASVASPFYWYDLEKEEATGLLLYPFCYMEANSFFEQKYSPMKALEEMRHFHGIIKSVDGLFISIWHNSFLGTDRLFAGWRDIYSTFIKEIAG